jgi:hypothetical protein
MTRSLARQVLQGVYDKARADPISNEELEESSKRNWTLVDRPVGYRTFHVVAMVKKDDDEAKRKKARDYIDKARKALLPIAKLALEKPAPERTEDDRFLNGARPFDPVYFPFKDAISALDKDGLDVQAQLLHIFSADGTVIEHGVPRQAGTYDPAFVKGGMDLADQGRGALSERVESSFGYHIILLLEVTDAAKLSREERLALLHDRIAGHRAFRAKRGFIEEAKKQNTVNVMSNVEAVMHKVKLGEVQATP